MGMLPGDGPYGPAGQMKREGMGPIRIVSEELRKEMETELKEDKDGTKDQH